MTGAGPVDVAIGTSTEEAQTLGGDPQDASGSRSLPRHGLNNVLARIIALAEDLTDHGDQAVARTGEALIEQAELAARLLREAG